MGLARASFFSQDSPPLVLLIPSLSLNAACAIPRAFCFCNTFAPLTCNILLRRVHHGQNWQSLAQIVNEPAGKESVDHEGVY